MKLPLAAIREDPELQLRGGLDMDRVQAMIEFEEEGGTLPPITVVGEDNLLGDGHHRLYAAETSGKREIAATRVPGGKLEAIEVALRENDRATHLPLNGAAINKGVKMLLAGGWTQQKIADVTGINQKTITDIGNSAAMRGEIAKRDGTGKVGRPAKAVAVLPAEVHEKLNDTTLYRIASGVPIEQQAEFAAAVADAGLSEPRVREAIAALRRNGKSPTEAVESVTPIIRSAPASMADVAKQVRRRLEHFLEEPMTVEGVERNFWQVLEVLAANADTIPLETKGLADLMIDVSVKALHFADVLFTEAIEA